MTRINKLQDMLVRNGLDAMLVRDTSNIAYLTGFMDVFDEEQAHALLITAQGAILHTDSRYIIACADALGKQDQHCLVLDDEATTHWKWLAQYFTQGTLAIEDSISLAEFHKLDEALPETVKFQETTAWVLKARSVKDAVEIECMKAAQAVTDAAFTHIVGFIRPGLTEREVARELENYMFTHGASGLAFPTIVATGAHAAHPHAKPSDIPLEVGQCVVMDFGAKVSGYCSDMTRTVFLGKPDPHLARAYEALREANETAEALLRPGITGAEAHQKAVDILDAAGFKDAMGHGLGHSLGIDVHEDPVLAPRNKEALVAGNVVTVEPGIYIPGEFGMRLEDFGLITEDGFDRFTQSSHDIVIL